MAATPRFTELPETLLHLGVIGLGEGVGALLPEEIPAAHPVQVRGIDEVAHSGHPGGQPVAIIANLLCA